MLVSVSRAQAGCGDALAVVFGWSSQTSHRCSCRHRAKSGAVLSESHLSPSEEGESDRKSGRDRRTCPAGGSPAAIPIRKLENGIAVLSRHRSCPTPSGDWGGDE